MSYFDLKKDPVRYAFTVVEIDLDINDPALDDEFALEPNSYGTPKTTDDARAFTGADFKTYRYSDQQLFGVDHFPHLIEAKTNPPEIKPGESIGFRSTASIKLRDFITNDAFELNSSYADRRVTGSHFAKLFARNQLKNRKIRVIRGYNPNEYDLANCRVENYVIDSWSGPDVNGNIAISAVDVLKLTNSENAKVPEVSKGTLTSGINEAVTSIDYTSTVADEYGAVSATGVIAINKEVMTYTVASAGTSGTLNVVRGAYSSETQSHEAGDVIQKCLVYDEDNIIDIFKDLVIDKTSIPASYEDASEWSALKAGDLSTYNLSRVITKPIEVKKLATELVQVGGLSVYTDVVDEKIKIIASPAFDDPVITFTEDEHFEQDTLRVKQDFSKLITRQTIFWAKRNPTEGNNENNYAKRFSVIEGVQEAGANLGVQEEGKEILSDWLANTVDGNQVATTIVQRNVNRFSEIPDVIDFEIDSRYIGPLDNGEVFGLGSVFSFVTSLKTDAGLNPRTITAQCVKLAPSGKDDKWKVQGLTYKANIPANVDYYIEDDALDYELASDPDFSPILADGAREYVVVLKSGVTIGQDSADHAFKQGSFPAGATLKFINAGRILGKGGAGGAGGNVIIADDGAGNPQCFSSAGNAGSDGGDALEFTTDVTLDNSLGLIGGGGGGGQGSAGVCGSNQAGDGGGGGQGRLGGAGGAKGTFTDSFGGQSGSDGSAGAAGTRSYAGTGGNDGGGLGEDGGGASGGSAGNAITTNGNTISIIAGNNSEQIKGNVV